MNPRQPSIMNKDGSFSTHKMASAEIGGMHIAYPTIVMKGGKLIELGEREAIDHALTTGEFRRFDSDASARKYAEGGYKTGTALTDEAQEKRAKEEETTGSILRYYGRKSDDRAAAGEEMAEFDKHYRTRAGQVIDEPFVHKELLRIGGSIENLDKSLDQVSGLFKETADRIAKDAMAGEGIDRFTLDDGHVDHDEVNKWVGEVRGKYGYQSREVDDQLRQRIERAVRERPIEKLFNKEMEPVLEAIGKERQDAFRQAFGDSPEAMSADSVLLRATNDLARERDQYGALAQTEADQENDRVQQQGGRLKAEYDTNISEIQQAYDTGRIDEATANQMVQAINEAHQAQVSSLAQDNLRRINFINAKYNRAYNQSQQAIVAQADRSIAALQEKFAKTYAEDPALAARLQKEANDAWGRAATKIEGAKATAEQMRRDMAGINAPRDVFIRSTAGAMGSTVAGLGSSAGLDGVRAWGKMLSEANEMPPARTKEFSDWLDLNNLAQITGQVTGSMLPGTVAGGITTIGTGFVGAPAGLSMVMGGLINWGSEAYSASGNIRDEVYAATMDRAKADKAEADLFRSYVDIAPTFAFDMLPFAGKLLGSIGSRAGRMATGAGIELSTELIQERHNQIAEENVREGRDPWEGYSDKILDPKATKETLIQIGPVALMGAAGHITSKSDKQIAAERVADLLAKNSLADVLGNGGISQWMAQMRLRDGDNVVKQAVAALYLGGHIDEKQADLLAALDKDGRLAHDEAVQSMLTSGQAPAYVALRAQGLAMERHAAEMPAGPAQAAAIERAKNMALQAKNIIMGATADYVQVNLPGGTPMVMDVQAATRMLTPEKGAEFALNGVLSNGVSVMGFGKGTGVVAAFQQMVNAAHQKMADELSRARETRAMQQQEFNERHATDRDQARNDEDDDLAERRWMERKRREADAAKTPASTQPKGSLRQDMAAAAANAVAPPPANETNETGGTKTEGTNGGAVTLSPPGTTNRVAALSPEDDALLEDDENDTGSPSTNEPTTTPPAVQGIQGEDQGGAPTAPPDTGAPPGVPPAPEPAAAEPVAKPAPKKKATRKKSTPEDIATQRKNMLGALDGIRKVLSDLGVPLDVANVKQGYDPIGGVTDLKEANRLLAPFGATIDKSGQVELVTPRGSAKFMPIDIDGIIKDAKSLLSDRTFADTSGLRGSAKTVREKIVADYKGPTGERDMDVAAVRQLLDDAEANVEEARKSGNKKILAVFEAALDRLKKQYPSVETSAEISDADAMMDEFIARANAGRIESAEEAKAAAQQTQIPAEKEPWQMTRDEFLDAATLDKEFRKQYAGRSSRTNPSETPIPKVGSWRISKSAGWNKYGDNIEQLREIPIDKVRGAEDPKQEGRQFDVERYAQFMQDGKKPPPISAAEIGDGTFRINDGHRRLAAHEMVGRKTILAWVSPAFDTGLREPSGKIIETDLTHQSAVKKALAEGKPVPSEVLAEYPDLKPQQTSIGQAPAQAEAPLPKKETAAEKRSRELREAERAKKEAKKEATRLADEQDAADARAYESAALFKEGTIPVDEILIMHSPNEGADRKVSYRGPVGKDKSMVVIVGSGHQMAVPNEWLRGGDDFAAREAKRRQYEKEVADQLKFEQQNEFEQKKSAELANAKTYQTRNGWEIVRDGVFYHIRDPHTKEVWYKSGSLNRVREVADETTLETTPTAEVPANAQVPVASPAVEAGAATTVDSITEVSRDNDKSPTQVEYKIPGWEGYTIVVRKRPGGWAMYILKDGNDYEIHGAGKEEPTPRLAAGSGAERLNRNREKVEQMLQGPQQQRPSGKAPVKTGKPRTDRVLKALRALLPDLSIIIPKTQEEYARITEGIKEGLSSGWGVYDPASRRIIVNPASPDLKQTLFHEAAHPVIAALMHNDPARFATFYNEVVAEAGGKYARYGKQYGDQPLSTQQQEALVEYLADVAAGKIDIGKGSLLERIADFLRGIMEALGFKADTIDLSRPDNVRSFARKLSNALNEGITITGLTPSTDPTVMWAKEMGISVEEAQRQYDAVVAQYTNKDGTKKDGWMKAPNGKATNLNELQWVQTRTPAFLNWFGDFLNDPENASKVVDANGEPLVVYHGTKGDFDTFDSGMRGSRHGTTAAKKAFFFTASAEAASNFAGNEGSLMPVFLNVRNVSRSDFTEVAPWDDKTGHRKRNEVVQRAVRAGRDGVMFENMADFGPRSTVVAVFSPNQIKSATANTGQFDTANPNINQQLTDKEGNSIDPSEVAARAKKANLSAARVREIMERNGEDEADIRAVEKAMEEQAGPNVFTMDDADMEDYFDSHFGKKAKGSPGQFSNARNATYFFRDQAHFNQWMGERYAEGDLDGMTEAFSEADSRTKVAYIRDVQKRGDDHEKGWAARMATGAPLPSGRQPVARTTPRPMPQGGVMTGSGGGSTNGPTPPTPRPQRPRTSRVDFNFTALVQLMKEFGNVPRVNKALRTALGRQKGDVTELMKRLLWDEKLATRVLAHEIGHFIDHMIQVTGDKKGFAKRLAPLQQFSTKVNKELKQDAKALSREWRGDFDDADTYRNSASELFADVMSAILNDPEWVNQKFPRIHDAFQHLLDGKPEFAAAYDELTVRISTDAVVQAWMDQQDEARERSIQQITTPNKEHEEGVLGQAQGVFVTPWYHIAHIEGRERSRDIGLTYIDRLEISNIFHLRENAKFESDYNEKVQPWLDRVNPDDRDAAAADLHKYIQANRTIHERRAAGRWFEDNPTEAKELLTRLANMEPALRSFAPDVARLQSGGEAYDLAARMIRVVHDLDGGKEAGPAVKRVAAAIDDMKLGANGEATMVAFNVRGKLLNPGGLTPDTAAGVIAALKDRLEDERFAALEKAQNELSELLYQTQAAAAREGLISDKVFNEVIAPNRGNYAPYAVLDYWGGRVGGRMAEQVGTAKDIADTILATQMKVAAINAWRKHQHIVDLLVRAYRAAGQGKLVTIGEALKDVRDIESIRAKNRGDDKSRLVMYIDGVPHVVEFGDDPGKSFERAYENENYRESLGILAKAPAVLQATMQLFTVLQPTFWLRNIPRGLFTAMGRIGTRNVLKSTFSPTRQMKAIRMAWNYAQAPRGAPMIPEVRDLVDRGILLPPRLSLAMSSDAENQRILMVGGLMMGYDAQRYAGASTAWTRSALKRKVVDNFTLIASMYEAYEKVMNVLTLKGMKHISRQKATGVAVRSGIPKGGVSGRNKMLNLATETAMPWTRVSIQGTRSSLDIWRDPQLGGGFRKRLFFFEVMPRLLNVGIGIGLLKMLLDKFGDDDDDDDEKLGVAGAYREAMQRVSPYKAGLDRMIPVAFYDPHTGKYTSIRSWENSTDVPSHIETVSLRIPSSEEGRTWMPLIYNTLANQFSEMEIAGKSSLSLAGDWATGTLIPGLNPIIDLGVKVGYDMVIQGENPDDDFTHYPMANPLLFNAGWGNGRGEAVAGAALTRLGGPGQLAADALLLSEAIDPRALKATSGRSSQDQTPFAEKLMLLRPFLSYDNAAPRREHVRQKVASEELRGKARSVMSPEVHELYQFYHRNRGRKEKLDAREAVQYEAAASMVKDVWGEATLEHKNTAGETVTDTLNFNFGAPYKLDGTSMSYHIYGRALSAAENKGSKMLLKELRNELDSLSAPYRAVFADPDTYIYAIGGGPKGK